MAHILRIINAEKQIEGKCTALPKSLQNITRHKRCSVGKKGIYILRQRQSFAFTRCLCIIFWELLLPQPRLLNWGLYIEWHFLWRMSIREAVSWAEYKCLLGHRWKHYNASRQLRNRLNRHAKGLYSEGIFAAEFDYFFSLLLTISKGCSIIKSLRALWHCGFMGTLHFSWSAAPKVFTHISALRSHSAAAWSLWWCNIVWLQTITGYWWKECTCILY